MENLDLLKEKIEKFSSDRDWNKFHSPVNLAKSIVIESGELLECFQWSNDEFKIDKVKEELADVINYCIQMSIKLNLNITDIVLEKLYKNEKKYPVELSRGNSKKYDEL